MSASRFFLFGTTLLKSQQISSSIPSLTHLHKPFPHQNLCLNRYCSATAIDAVDENTADAVEARHPWPEWVAFVDKLKSKGYYFTVPTRLGPDSAEDSERSKIDSVYTDMNVSKDPCLSFARDRFDVLKSLSKKDIQTVVECGCPNVLRKAVNSGKRLRAYLGLDEAEVCSACNLRGSCDRAYVILKDSEAAARTVDIVRILLFYALDPLVLSGGEKPSGREIIEISTKKLLSQLIELSEMTLDPALPQPAARAPRKKDYEANLTSEAFSQNAEMKRGDWMCSKCNFMNFSRNIQCRQCNEDGPKRASGSDVEMKKGDWICNECTFVNFSRNIKCLKCKSEGPRRISSSDVEMKKGDWNCPHCAFMNFASNTKCLRCRESRPKRQLNPGEWECPSCDFLNYRRNTVCLKCKHDRPNETAKQQHEEHEWSPL